MNLRFSLGALGRLSLALLFIGTFYSCQKEQIPSLDEASTSSTLLAKGIDFSHQDGNLLLVMAETYTVAETGEVGTTVFFDNRGNKQLDFHFVPNDPRRDGRSNITYITDLTDGQTASGLSAADTDNAIDASIATWNDVNCSNIPITKNPSPAQNIGSIAALFGYGNFQGFIPWADIINGGWYPQEFFDAVFGPGNSVIAVTFTLIFIDDEGNPTDIDNDGKLDAGLREIYYNDGFAWATDGSPFAIDVETVSLHELGHGLSQDHFGKAFRTESNGKIHFAPRAVMNAAYTGVQREIKASDNAGHCSIWANWPN